MQKSRHSHKKINLKESRVSNTSFIGHACRPCCCERKPFEAQEVHKSVCRLILEKCNGYNNLAQTDEEQLHFLHLMHLHQKALPFKCN